MPSSRPDAVRAVVWGAGGFTGGELLRLLAVHPHLELTAALSSTHADARIDRVHPGLVGWTDVAFSAAADWDWSALSRGCWTVFSALGHGEAMQQMPPLLERLATADVKWVDLSGDFRLDNPEAYATYYGRSHVAPAWLDRFVYGLPELNREAIRGATHVSNPGCFATGAQLAILPAAAAHAGLRAIAVDGKTGSSGAGATPRETTHHPNRANNFRAYKLLGHQHVPEIERGWRAAGGSPDVDISFAPQMAPMVRGIFTTAHLFLERPTTLDVVREWYARYYDDAPFVRLVEGESPAISDVWGTNRCDVSVSVSGRRAVVCTALDNLVKGGAGQAIQNANLMYGWAEGAGLLAPAPSPV